MSPLFGRWVFLLCVFSLASCRQEKTEKNRAYPPPKVATTGEAVVQIGPVVMTTDEFENRINRQSPFMRERMSDEEKRVAYIRNEARFELLAQEAWRRKFYNDPQIIGELKRAMVQKLVREENQRLGNSITLTEAELRTGFALKKGDYNKPAKVRFSQLVRYTKNEADKKAARQLLKKLRAEILRDEKKGQGYAFVRQAKRHSQDLQTKTNGGDLGFQTVEQMTKLYGAEVTKSIFEGLNIGDSVIVDAQDSVVLFKKTGQRNAVVRTLEMVKPRLRAKLLQEKRSNEFEKLVNQLADQFKMKIDREVAKKIKIDLSKPIGEQ